GIFVAMCSPPVLLDHFRVACVRPRTTVGGEGGRPHEGSRGHDGNRGGGTPTGTGRAHGRRRPRPLYGRGLPSALVGCGGGYGSRTLEGLHPTRIHIMR